MPAYRSAAEGEIRDAVVARIRAHRPNARVIHEINAGNYANRIDLIAVDVAEIIAVEIKSEKDKLDRLPAQMTAMKDVAHHAIAAIHEKFLVEQSSNKWAAHEERDGKYFIRALPDAMPHDETWVYPERRRALPTANHDYLQRWTFPNERMEAALPWAALNLLWRDEIYDLCGELRISVGRRATMGPMISQLRWRCTGKELTHGICAALRARECCEADPAIIKVANAA